VEALLLPQGQFALNCASFIDLFRAPALRNAEPLLHDQVEYPGKPIKMELVLLNNSPMFFKPAQENPTWINTAMQIRDKEFWHHE
jgi:hypothetical protein